MTVLLGLSAAFSWAFASVFVQKSSRLVDLRVMLVVMLLISTCLVVPVALIVDGLQGPFNLQALGPPALAGIAGNIGFLLMVKAMKVGSISIVAPIIALEGGLAAAVAVVLGERPSPATIALLALAAVGAVLVSIEPGRRTAKGAGWAVLAAFVYAVMLVAMGHTEQPAMTSAGIARVASLLTAIPLFLMVRQLPPRPAIKPLLAAGTLDAVGFAAFAIAASLGPLTVASVTSAQWASAAALIGIFFLRERLHINQYVGIAVTMLAVTGLGLLI